MGEVQGTLFPLRFNRSVTVKPTVEKLTADSGALLLREVGQRLGQATDQFNTRWAALSTELADLLDRIADTELTEPAQRKLARAWVARDDARNYIIFGDPAVRLRIEDMPVLP
jgi:hypothetical protein